MYSAEFRWEGDLTLVGSEPISVHQLSRTDRYRYFPAVNNRGKLVLGIHLDRRLDWFRQSAEFPSLPPVVSDQDLGMFGTDIGTANS